MEDFPVSNTRIKEIHDSIADVEIGMAATSGM
jgi:hypothetical protein